MPDRVGRVQAALHRDLGDARKVVERGHVADREHLGMARQREVGQHLDAPDAVGLGARGLRELRGERRRLHARRPHDDVCVEVLGACRRRS